MREGQPVSGSVCKVYCSRLLYLQTLELTSRVKSKKKKQNIHTLYIGSKETFVEEVGFPVVFEVGEAEC